MRFKEYIECIEIKMVFLIENFINISHALDTRSEILHFPLKIPPIRTSHKDSPVTIGLGLTAWLIRSHQVLNSSYTFVVDKFIVV